MASSSESKVRITRLSRELREDSSHLHQLTRAIDALLAHPRIASNHWSELQVLFSELRDQLSLHFSLEEAEEYLNISCDANPECICTAEYLKLQHAELFENIRGVADAALDIPSDNERRMNAIVARYRRFRRSLDAHEEAEWNLVQRAFDEDLGVGD